MGINNKNYNSTNPTVEISNGTIPTGAEKDSSSSFNLAKVFGFMFAGLAITAGVAFLLGWIFTVAGIATNKSVYNGVQIGMIISAIALIILTFVIQGVLLKGKHSILVPAIIYAALMGFLLSTFTIFIDWRLLGIAFGITCGIFGAMFLIAALLGERANMLAFVALSLILGAGIVALITWIIMLCGVFNQSIMTTLWIMDFVVFGAVMLITIFDLANIKSICDKGEMTTNLSLYCAFTIYVDFIYIFIKIVYYLAIASRR